MSAPIFAETHRAVLRRRGKLHGNLRSSSWHCSLRKRKEANASASTSFLFGRGRKILNPCLRQLFAETHRAVLRRRGKLHGNLRGFSFCLLYEKEKQSCLRTTAFLFGTLLQNRSVPQVFSKSIHVSKSADRLIPWR